jgi:hypothetical protein
MPTLRAYITANLAWAQRAGERFAAAASEMDAESYKPKHFLRDAYRTWVRDPMEWWGDVIAEAETGVVLINAPGITTKKSEMISVINVATTEVTSLRKLGGAESMDVNVHVRLDEFPAKDEVQVVLYDLTAGDHPSGHYLGFLIDDERIVATVVAVR